MTYSQAVASAIFTLAYATTEEDADRILTMALSRGADQATCDALRREWAAMQAKCVQQIGGVA